MAKHSTNAGRRPPERGSTSGEDLFRDLVREAQSAPPLRVSQTSGGIPEEILLEVSLGGDQYLLVRLRRPRLAPTLSPRELEIARLVAKGLPNKAIGIVLDISIWTVAAYLRRVFIKLNVTSRAAMVAELVSSGLIRQSSSSTKV